MIRVNSKSFIPPVSLTFPPAPIRRPLRDWRRLPCRLLKMKNTKYFLCGYSIYRIYLRPGMVYNELFQTKGHKQGFKDVIKHSFP